MLGVKASAESVCLNAAGCRCADDGFYFYGGWSLFLD